MYRPGQARGPPLPFQQISVPRNVWTSTPWSQGGTVDEGDPDPGARQEVVDRIRQGLDSVVPAAKDMAFSHVWTCFRPATPDRRPVIDRVGGVDNAWFAAGHSGTGLLMAAATGEILASWIHTGERPAVAAPFTAARFAPPTHSAG